LRGGGSKEGRNKKSMKRSFGGCTGTKTLLDMGEAEEKKEKIRKLMKRDILRGTERERLPEANQENDM